MKKTLMMVTALGMSMAQANADVDSTTKSGVQSELIATADKGTVKSPDALAMKIQELQNQLQPEQESSKSALNTVQNNISDVNTDDGIYNLIKDIESKALHVTKQNDKLSTYEEDLKARRLAEMTAQQSRLSTNRNSSIGNSRSVTNRGSQKGLNNSSSPVIAARRASRSAHSRSKGLCARYVRKALQAGGYQFTPNASAYQYATRGTLRQAGFVKISNNSSPQVGDVVVISRSRAHPHGHISIYDGSRWVSDFHQRGKNPYSRDYPYTTWRDARYLNNASANGLYMANR